MLSRPLSRILVLLLAAIALAGCRDSTGPDFQPLDPARTQADADAMRSAFDSPAINQFFVAAGYIDVGAAMHSAIASARHTVSTQGWITAEQQRAIANALGEMLLGHPGIAEAAVIPQELRGTTFVFDAGGLDYVPSERPGAPGNGVRYILYAVDGSFQIDPNSEVGYIDVEDLAPAGANTFGLRLTVVGGGTTWLEYVIEGSATETTGTVDVTGFVTNGTTRVEYITRVSVFQTEEDATFNIEFQYTVPARSFGVVGLMIGLGGESVGQVEIVVSSNRTQIRYLFQSGDSFTGTILVNGNLFANVTETPQGILVTGAGGNQLTEAEQEVLESLLLTAVEAVLWSFVLLTPVSWAIAF